MVDEQITDGTRIADVLRAEIDGRETGALDRLSVDVDADGTTTVRCDGHPLAVLEPGEVELEVRFGRGGEAVRTAGTDAGLSIRSTDGTVTVTVETAAETKRAVDLLRAVADRIE